MTLAECDQAIAELEALQSKFLEQAEELDREIRELKNFRQGVMAKFETKEITE